MAVLLVSYRSTVYLHCLANITLCRLIAIMSAWRPHHRRTSSMPVSNEQLEELDARRESIDFEVSSSFNEDDLDTTASSGMYIEEETEVS